jgi:hypothetical protein
MIQIPPGSKLTYEQVMYLINSQVDAKHAYNIQEGIKNTKHNLETTQIRHQKSRMVELCKDIIKLK